MFIFTLFAPLKPCGGGTLLLSGSHHLINRFFESGRRNQTPMSMKQFRIWPPQIAEICGATSKNKDPQERVQHFMQEDTEAESVRVRVIEVTSEPDS
jgi:hypothetical protein